MGLTAVLDTIIGLCFAYFLLSLFASWANESFAQIVNRRGKYLFDGLREMLREQGSFDRFVRHPLIESLDKIRRDETGEKRKRVDGDVSHKARKGVFPSYLPTATVATVLLDIVSPNGGANRFAEARSNIAMLPESKLRTALLSIAERADNDIEKLRKGIEDWYSNTMDRVSGWYKSHTQVWLFFFGFVLAFAFNVDTFKIVRELWADPAARAMAVQGASNAMASEQVRKAMAELEAGNEAARRQALADKQKAAKAAAPEKQKADAKSAADSGAEKDADKRKAALDKLKAELELGKQFGTAFGVAEGSSIPVGWRPGAFKPVENCMPGKVFDLGMCAQKIWANPDPVFFKLMGIFVTACAVALGAPFWFELVNKLLDIRSSGRRPEDKK
jgi:hypothetical protein